MAVERTLSIIKPDAVGKNAIGQIISRFEDAGLQVVAAKMLHLSDAAAGGFYAEHKERPFYPDLVAFMTSGPVVVQVLEGEGAIGRNRELMAQPTLRKQQLARYGPILRNLLMLMPFTALILQPRRSGRSAISLPQARSAHAESQRGAAP